MSFARGSTAVYRIAVALSALLLACARERPEPEVPAAAEPRPTLAANTYDQPAPSQDRGAVIVEQHEASVRVSESIAQKCDLPDRPENAPQFDFDRSTLRPRGMNILDEVVRCMESGSLKDRDLIITGFADPRGTDDYNIALGMRRANAARDYLVGQRVLPERVSVRSRGEADAVGTDPPSWQLDRRVEVEEAAPKPSK